MKALNELKDLLWEPEDGDVCAADGGYMQPFCILPLESCGGGGLPPFNSTCDDEN